VNLASRLEHEAPPGGVLISFETYALVKDKIRCEERGHVQVKGIAQPVATYAVVGLNEDPEQVGTEHLRLELEINRMSGDERKLAADALRRALGLLEKGDQGQPSAAVWIGPCRLKLSASESARHPNSGEAALLCR
jgi:adenylate cyclase